MILTACFRASYRDTPFAIHRAGCPDIERTERRRNDAHTTELNDFTVKEAIAFILDPDVVEMGYSEEHVRVFPCCKGAR